MAHTSFSRDHWAKFQSTNPLERPNKAIKRRTNAVGVRTLSRTGGDHAAPNDAGNRRRQLRH
ncbi:transposase [Ruegeria intermedia]|uniref:transposase n=1 Tax=Ruegeria intermedia TaxID=996115 RepID=UPI003742D86A